MNRICTSVLFLTALTAMLTGCGVSTISPSSPQSLVLSGEVFGGALPINAAHVYLYAANTGGFAGPSLTASATNASISLLKSATGTAKDANGNYYVTTSASGAFSLSGDYTACATGQQLYLYASGGNALGGDPTKTGGNNGVNTAAGLLAVLGECSNVTSSTQVHLNEMSTVAAAYALAGFATDATHIADDETVSANTTQSLAMTGMANAFANSGNLVSEATGAPLAKTPAGNGTVPTATLNTIANILAGCVQSAGSTSAACSDLFTFTGTSTASDTATAAINLAHHPVGVSGSSVTVAKLFNDIEPETAFTPNLAAAPNDFTIAIALKNYNNPMGIAVNGDGTVYTVDSSQGLLSEFAGPNASYALSDFVGTGSGPLDSGTGIAIDQSNSIYVSYDDGYLCAADGYPYTSYYGSGCASDAYVNPSGVAVSPTGLVFTSSYQSNKPVLQVLIVDASQGVQYARTLDGSGTDGNATSVAIDTVGTVWLGLNAGIGQFSNINTAGSDTYTHFAGSVDAATGIAIGPANSVWVASSGNNAIIEFTGSTTSYTAKSPFTGGGLDAPSGIAMDGAGNAWASNLSYPSISEFTNAGVALSPAKGFTGTAGTAGGTTGPLATPEGIAVDSSGNVWVADYNNVAVMYVGLGVPVVTPIAEAVAQNKLGVRP